MTRSSPARLLVCLAAACAAATPVTMAADARPRSLEAEHGVVCRLPGERFSYFGWPSAARSGDGGATWNIVGRVPVAPRTDATNYHEPHVVELPSGRLLAAIRVESHADKTLAAAGMPSFTIMQSESDDGGATWSMPRWVGVQGSPPHLLRHSSGVLVMTYGYREQPLGQRVAISRDDGRTWEAPWEIRVDAPDPDLGYPATVELGDGSLFTVCYQKAAKDEKCSLLWSRWKLPVAAVEPPLAVGSRRELFVDRAVVDRLDGAALKLHEPVSGGTAIRVDKPWEGPANFGMSVIELDGRLLMYYRGWSLADAADENGVNCVAESRDGGATWTKPALDLVKRPDWPANNVIATVEGEPRFSFPCAPWVDTRPGVPASERVKLIESVPVSGKKHTAMNDPEGPKRLVFWASADGFAFRKLEPQPEFVSDLPNSFDGGNTMFWSEAEGQYVLHYRWYDGDWGKGRRSMARATSKDLMTWTKPVGMTYGDSPREQFYVNNTQPYFRAPHLSVAPAARFMEGRQVLDEQEAQAIGVRSIGKHVYFKDCSDGVLLTSRAGTTAYDRTFMETFVRPGLGDPNWVSRANYPLTGILPAGPGRMQMFVSRGYMQDSWHVERLLLRTDGFASVSAPWAGGGAGGPAGIVTGVTVPRGRPGDRLPDLAATLESHRGFAEVVASLRAGHGGTIGGTWGSASALAVAAVVRGLPDDTLAVVLPHAAEAEAFVDDLAIFGTTARLLPALEDLGADAAQPAAEDPAAAERLAVVKLLGRPPAERPRLVVTSIQAVLAPLPDPREIAAGTRRLAVGGRVDPEELADWLAARGWQAADVIEGPGQFARRGGIMDLFAADWDRPVRMELDGDEIEGLRTFDTVSQRSVAELPAIDLTALAAAANGRRAHLADLLPAGSRVALVEPGELAEEARRMHERLGSAAGLFPPDEVFARLHRLPSVALAALAPSSLEATATLAVESVERFTGVLDRVKDELETVGREQEVWVVCPSDAEEQRLRELLADSAPARSGRLHFARGRLSGGFRLVPEKVVLVSSAELFNRDDAVARPVRQRLARAIDTFLDLHEGDFVVHVAHGIGRYKGLKLLERHGRTEEFLEIEFAESTRIYVPASCIELVQKYVGGTKLAPKLAKIGGTAWEKQKRAVQQAVADMAADMIRLQATRESRPGVAFPADTPWQRQFEEAFPYDETPDQLTAMEAIRADMQRPRPMDRLLCGDVGFGKTELAMRAAFKAVEAGSQVAVLVPTTVLAEQHRRTFAARFAEFPFVIRSLSRLTGGAEARDTLEGLARKTVDIVIGTHRLAQADIHFANLGLLVVDEEQRFGVDVKERLKALRASVDVLTMTATPIPRTLHMSLLGIRDISNLATPPATRIAVETRVGRWDESLVRTAIERELARGGQVFFVHNRILDIHKVAARLAAIVPEATIGIAHGRLSETELEEVMLAFVAGTTDILLATTIIESGLDIPRANTIFIDEADGYGLADLHQLRGRVGRSHHRAWCYLLVDETARLTQTAAKRLRAIQEFSSMGAGFSLAMRDLEIRGAGNLLGTQQSGHIATVGYELYCRLLEQAVRGMKKLPPAEPPPVNIDLPGEAWLPRDYIADFRAKIDVYRRLSRATAAGQVDDLAAELADRFGPPPDEVRRLLELARLRVAALGHGIDSITRHPGMIVIGHHDRRRMERLREAAARRNREVRVVDQKTAVVPLRAETLADPDALLVSVRSLLDPS